MAIRPTFSGKPQFHQSRMTAAPANRPCDGRSVQFAGPGATASRLPRAAGVLTLLGTLGLSLFACGNQNDGLPVTPCTPGDAGMADSPQQRSMDTSVTTNLLATTNSGYYTQAFQSLSSYATESPAPNAQLTGSLFSQLMFNTMNHGYYDQSYLFLSKYAQGFGCNKVKPDPVLVTALAMQQNLRTMAAGYHEAAFHYLQGYAAGYGNPELKPNPDALGAMLNQLTTTTDAAGYHTDAARYRQWFQTLPTSVLPNHHGG